LSKQFSRVYVLDFFRGIAALGIIVFHVLGPYYPWLQSLYVLVDFFFVLSGYVLANSMEVTSWNKVCNFIRKRAQRIFPMVLSALLFTEILRVTAILINDQNKTQSVLFGEDRLINLLIAVTLFQVFSFPSQLLLFPLWSLSAEWIVNIVGVVCRRIFGQIQILLFISIGLTLFCTSTYLGILESESNWAISLGRCLICFGVGQAIQQMRNFQLSKKAETTHMVLSIVYSLLYLFLVHEFGQNALILAPLIFGYIVWSFSMRAELFGNGHMKTISSRAGSYSYGLYVWHIPALGLCDVVLKKSDIKFSSTITMNTYQFLGTLATSIVLTFFVRKYIENLKFLKRKQSSS
jgi:peptidoglycan/LPS O-acetylase OafA/YrhL